MNCTVRSTALAATLAAVVALAACSRNATNDDAAMAPAASDPTAATQPAAAPSPDGAMPGDGTATALTVTTVDLGNAVGADNRVSTPMARFAGADTIHASVATDGAGGILAARWTYEDGQVVDTQEKAVPAGAQVTDFSITKPDGWPSGHYTLDISSGGAVVQTRTFEVG